MDAAAFDALTKTMAGRRSRRRLLALAGSGAAGGVRGLFNRGETRAYSSNCRRFILSGGQRARKKIDVDDDLSVFLIQDDKQRRIFLDDDGTISNNLKPIKPIKFRARVGDELRIVASDAQGPCRSLTKLYLHCEDGGAPKRLTRGFKRKCNDRQGVFFDETFAI